MDYRGLAVLGACLAAGLVPLLPACKGPDPGAITFEERPGSGGETQGSSTSSSSGATSSGGTDGGAAGITDVFKDPATGTVEAFKYEDPQAVNAIDPPPTGHVGDSAPPMQGKACVATGCHADSPKWGAGGTVYAALTGGALPDNLKKKVQIRIVNADGTEYGTFYPDDDGNFYLSAPVDKPFPGPGSRVGIRTEQGQTKMMTATIEGAAGANCNAVGCHNDGMRIFAQ